MTGDHPSSRCGVIWGNDTVGTRESPPGLYGSWDLAVESNVQGLVTNDDHLSPHLTTL